MHEAIKHLDVLVVGAGLSGIAAGYHLQQQCPDRSYAIFEGRDTIGGTWDLFRYPGIRSDSDMHTLGYPFRPWTAPRTIADGASIREYVQATARENGIDARIRFGHRVVRADWSSQEARWTVECANGERVTCSFLFGCTGYYRYDRAYTPEFPGIERFRGTVMHPQFWDEDYDYAGKRVVVIGSGATAVTLVPAMADTAAHVTMLQRSPSYIVSLPVDDPLAKVARTLLPTRAAYHAIRWRNLGVALFMYHLSRRRPQLARKLIMKGVKAQLPRGYEVEKHFNPRYDPWDQRLCFVPDGDLFRAIRRGRASVVTDRIETFTETGVRLESGEELEADLIVTATGLDMEPIGGVTVTVDGEIVELPKHMGYKGMLLSDVPNLAFAVGYTNASWTLKCDLTCQFVCRLLNHMAEHGYDVVVAPRDPSVEELPFIDLNAGYVLRALDKFPRQGAHPPWRLYQNYARDYALVRFADIEDGTLRFTRSPARVEQPAAT